MKKIIMINHYLKFKNKKQNYLQNDPDFVENMNKTKNIQKA